jgi:hypothetical protein
MAAVTMSIENLTFSSDNPNNGALLARQLPIFKLITANPTKYTVN